MTLSLTAAQKQFLDANGPMKARDLQRVFVKSVKDQEEMTKQAEKLRKKR